MQEAILNHENLTVIEDGAEDLIVENGQVAGVIGLTGEKYHAPKVVITTGTFLKGEIHIGAKRIPAGRVGEAPAIGLSDRLYSHGPADGPVENRHACPSGWPHDRRGTGWRCSRPMMRRCPSPIMTDRIEVPQISCGITWTTPETHAIIEENMEQSAVYSGAIAGRGPRYCPSIEDKVNRFADRDRHQVFLEPEGLDDHTVYPNGISTSLPEDVQERFVRTIPGLENVEILQHAYAIEYDYVDPRALECGFGSKALSGRTLSGGPDQWHDRI
jgi:tRNA uridine 5-carboxymethylaminomethyl modification enzyme